VRYLVLSDIHSNWEALRDVLASSAGQYDQILCCGDLVGYGADPNAVVEWCRDHLTAVVRGNHDRASAGLEDLEWFNPVAKAAAEWTLRELTPENAGYVRQLPKGPLPINGFQMAHGSCLDEDEYITQSTEAAQMLAYLEAPLVFFGHTHVQGGFLWNRTAVEKIKPVEAKRNEFTLDLDPGCAYILNPGSVGQPRDGDPRAGYLLYTPSARRVVFKRVRYDVSTAQAKIRRALLPGILADRLAWGK
jgi:predicted phosphodiesterase